ncbi:MAG: hypothetical protein E7551_01565 [Ruminococcaceae bacterium]|nr:hypothetical protein [Oscillospiraceae bacterium]
MSKKLLSVLLCVLMVISSISCLFSMSVSAAPGYLFEELFADGAVETTGGATIPVKLDSIMSKQLSEVNSKYLGKWLRASGGVALGTDLDSTGEVWTAESAETFPTTFGANAQVVSDPTNANNKAIRTVQSLQQYVDSSKIATGNTYTLMFDYINRGPEGIADKENRFDFTFSTPKGTVQTTEVTNEETGETTTEVTGVTVGTAFSSPFTFENFKLLKHSDANLTAGAYTYDDKTGIRFTLGTTSTDTWQSVTVQFTLGAENTEYYNTYIDEKVILAAFSQEVSLTDGGDDHAIYYDNLSLKLHSGAVTGDAEFYGVDGVKVDSNDYAGATVVQNTDGTLTATVDYDNTNKAISFIGWYNGDTAISYNESITFAGDGSVLPTPRFLTYNILADSGSFENIEDDTVLRYTEAYPAADKTPNYPEGNAWGTVAAQGYVTYPTDEEGNVLSSSSDTYYITTYADTVYGVDGTSYSTLAQSAPRTAKWYANTNRMTVNSSYSYSGSKSLSVKSGDLSTVLGIKVKPNTNYQLSYYLKTTATTGSTKGFGSAIMSSINVGNTQTTTDTNIASVIDIQLPNYMWGAANFSSADYSTKVYGSTFTYGGLEGKYINTSITDGWVKVTHNFTTTANLSNGKVYLVITNGTGGLAYIDDMVCYTESDVKSYFSGTKAVKDDMVTEIPNANLPVTVELSNAQVAGVPVTATVNYDTTDTTMKFVGWYNGDELVSEDETITVTPATGDNYYPKFVTLNILAGAASYENFEVGEHLGYAVNTPTETDENGNLVEPVYGDNVRWSWNFNAGYITSNNGSESSFAQNVYAGTIYGNDGTAYTSTQTTGTRNATLKTDYPSYITTDKAHSGEKSVAMSAAIARGLSIPVEGGKTYKLSFYAISDATTATNYAVTTTLNVGGGKGASHMITEAEGQNDYIKYRLANGSIKPVSDWGKAELTFTVPDVAELDTVYLVLYCSSSSASVPLYIDDICCIEVSDNIIENFEFVDADGNVKETTANAYVSGEIVNNLNGTYSAIANFENDGNVYIFDGWYDSDGTLLSTDAEFTFTAGQYKASDLKAVVIDRNILDDSASFENYAANTDFRTTTGTGDALADKEAIAPTDNLWGVAYYGEYYKDNHFAIKTANTVTWAPTTTNVQAYYDKVGADKFAGFFGADATVDSVTASLADTIVPHTGDTMVAFSTKWRSAIRKIEGLTANTQYTVSFYVYSTLIGERVSTVAIADSYDGVNTSNLDNSAEDVNIISRLGVSTSQSDVRNWKKISISFNSGSNESVYLHIHFNGTDNNASVFSPIYVDDLTVAETVTNYVGTAIRASSAGKPQALRYKFQIANELIANGYADWEVEEYGSIAIRTYYLNGQELTLDGEYYGDDKERNVVKGVAYNKTEGKDIVFAKDVVNTEFTAALTGIGRKSDGSTNYLAWGDKYSVRNYIILKKGDNTITIYGETTAVASVFGVMDAILTSGNETDIATVNSILYNETNGDEIRAAYAERGYTLPETVE